MCVFSCTPWAPSSCMTKIRMHTMRRKSRSVGSTLSPRLNERRRLGTPGGRWGLRTCAPASEGGLLRNHSLWSGGCPALCTDSCARIWHKGDVCQVGGTWNYGRRIHNDSAASPFELRASPTAGLADGRWRTDSLLWSGRAGKCSDGEERGDRGVGTEWRA